MAIQDLKDRVQKLKEQLVESAATDPELFALANQIHAEELAQEAITPASGGHLLKVSIAPETLLKLANAGTKELIVTVTDA